MLVEGSSFEKSSGWSNSSARAFQPEIEGKLDIDKYKNPLGGGGEPKIKKILIVNILPTVVFDLDAELGEVQEKVESFLVLAERVLVVVERLLVVVRLAESVS